MRYSLESTSTASRPQVITTDTVLRDLSNSHSSFSDHLRVAERLGSIRIERKDETSTLTFAFEQAWKKRSESVRQETATHAYLAFVALANHGDFRDSDDPLELAISTERLFDGVRLGMNAVLQRPKGRDRDIALLTTTHMRHMARQLRYPEPGSPIVDSLVYSTVSKQSGISLYVNDAGGCSLDTDGNEYHPFSSKIELYSHNIYSREMQLICATGAIALAYYNKLSK